MKYGTGFDVGTAFFVAARENEENNIDYIEQRDSFFTIDLTEESKGLLDMLGVPYITRKGKLSVIGQDSIKFANMFRSEARRPLEKGCLSKKDLDALGILQVIISKTIGEPRKPNEIVKYSVTSTPLGTTQSFDYHKQQIENIFKTIGYDPQPIQEARAIALSELTEDRFTGLCVSMGSGTTTVYLGYYGIDNPDLQFSIGIAGDWIDSNSADMFAGLTKTKVQTVKERGFNIKNPNDGLNVDELEGQQLLEARAKEALSAYYISYITNVLRAIKQKFEHTPLPEFEGPIKLVIAGGTSLAGGFIDVFKEELAKVKLPIDISEVVHASNPKYAVAKGCLVAAQLEERKRA
jgi:actin-related protein